MIRYLLGYFQKDKDLKTVQLAFKKQHLNVNVTCANKVLGVY